MVESPKKRKTLDYVRMGATIWNVSRAFLDLAQWLSDHLWFL
ncbi:hypothetical protein AIIKEEIJ_06419 [Rhodococcus sp. YH1]|nr:hypothetical protein [Rhodococcus sp. YH1]NCL78908.1 hypothetical protein [Rhodococcus sp. YH1]